MKRIALSVFIFFLTFSIFSQTKLIYSGDSSYKMVERTNLRRYVNGKYSGLTSREVRSFISRTDAPDGVRSSRLDRWYDGNFFVVEETLRNSQATMAGIHDAIPSVFKISADGKMTMFEDNGYPTFRSFPSYTTQQLKNGDSWKSEGERAVDPMNKGIFTRIPILVLYTFEGSETYRGENVFRIKAIWQTNYGFSNFDRDPKGDSSLKQATGGHKADIIVRAATGEAILISDNVDETFTYIDGTQVNLKGTITMFTEYPPAIDRDKLLFALNRIAKADTQKPNNSKSSSNSSTNGISGQGNDRASNKNSTISSGKNNYSTISDEQKWQNNLSEKKPTSANSKSSNENGKIPDKKTNIASVKNSASVNENSSSTEKEKNSLSSGKQNANSNNENSSSNNNFGFGGISVTSSKSGGSSSSSSLNSKANAVSSIGKSALSERIASSKFESNLARNSSETANSSKNENNTDDDKNNMVFEETPAGIRLSVRDIKFKADSDEVLTTERGRLDEIAEVLKLAPNSQFLIEGHTASVGKPMGEQKLSEERARRIATELSKRGIAADKFICKGHGGNKPIASNSTDAGRAQNRRVEITILE